MPLRQQHEAEHHAGAQGEKLPGMGRRKQDRLTHEGKILSHFRDGN
jgi:hypothetical protein